MSVIDQINWQIEQTAFRASSDMHMSSKSSWNVTNKTGLNVCLFKWSRPIAGVSQLPGDLWPGLHVQPTDMPLIQLETRTLNTSSYICWKALYRWCLYFCKTRRDLLTPAWSTWSGTEQHGPERSGSHSEIFTRVQNVLDKQGDNEKAVSLQSSTAWIQQEWWNFEGTRNWVIKSK